MFIAEDLIYLQLAKTGSTHVAKLLRMLGAGVRGPKHQPAPPDLCAGRLVLCSIRSPWDWYASLWSFGLRGGGALHQRLTNTVPVSRMRALPPGASAEERRKAFSVGAESARAWRRTYRATEPPAAFRTWLSRMFDPELAADLREGYADSALCRFSGFMTYRYLRLCTRHTSRLSGEGGVASIEEIARFERDHLYVDRFLRQERLEDSLLEALGEIRPIGDVEREAVRTAERTNPSPRPLPLEELYDEASIELVGRRERFLVERFGYEAPRPRARRAGARS